MIFDLVTVHKALTQKCAERFAKLRQHPWRIIRDRAVAFRSLTLESSEYFELLMRSQQEFQQFLPVTDQEREMVVNIAAMRNYLVSWPRSLKIKGQPQ